MATKTNKEGWEDIQEFDPEEAQREREQEDKGIDPEIKRREKPD